ncbi:MAG TPA: hypothetical protein PLG15_00830 [Candidatus Gastranaerophilaceae bacterium]|nr:hypothetical protein [Candidatus Gastranaerophilaceae bacterium]HPT40912.1 hypothetical protein [Candidatus Gastranaerophilaceae bacterium]
MEEQEINVLENKPQRNWKNVIKISLITLAILLTVGFLLRLYIMTLPINGDDIYCEYKGKFNKIVCVQTGDIVPDWLDLDDSISRGLFGGNVDYSMRLIFAKDTNMYTSLKMVDKVFVTDLRRKFIYEKAEQTLSDYIKFKKFVLGSKMSNWGSVVLYCSNSNLTEDVCKQMKSRHK